MITYLAGLVKSSFASRLSDFQYRKNGYPYTMAKRPVPFPIFHRSGRGAGFFCPSQVSEQRNAQIRLIQLVLADPEVPPRYFEAAVIEDLHQNYGGHVIIYPRMVAEGLSEGVAGNNAYDPKQLDRLLYNAPCLDAGDGSILLPAVGEDERRGSLPMLEKDLKGFHRFRMKGYGFPLLCFVLRKREAFLEGFLVEIVQVGPLEAEQIADPKGSMGAKNDQDMVAKLSFEQKVTGQVAEIVFISDRFGRRHSKNPFVQEDFSGFETGLLQRGRCNGI